jgi:hypothetical protein
MVHDRPFRTLYAGKASGVTVTLIARPLAHYQSAAAELVRRGYKASLSDENTLPSGWLGMPPRDAAFKRSAGRWRWCEEIQMGAAGRTLAGRGR